MVATRARVVNRGPGVLFSASVRANLRESWWIGEVEIPTRVVLAPMAGVSVQAFRRQGRRYGAGLVCSEMVSCAGIEHRNEKTLGYLRVATDEHPLAIQIFGSEPAVMAEAARMVEAAGADIVDMNFGCPVRKVTKTGGGAQGNPWAVREIPDGDGARPAREEVAAELIHFIHETVRELGEHRASGFLKKFYSWYLGHGRFPKPFKQELVQLDSTGEVVTRLLAAAPGAGERAALLEAELPARDDEILLDQLPISVYGGG